MLVGSGRVHLNTKKPPIITIDGFFKMQLYYTTNVNNLSNEMFIQNLTIIGVLFILCLLFNNFKIHIYTQEITENEDKFTS